MEIKTSLDVWSEMEELKKDYLSDFSSDIIETTKRWISVESLKEFMRENSNPCMKCGSVQCSLCYLDFEKELSK